MSKQIPLFKDFVDDEEVNKLKIDNLTQIGSSAHADHKRVKDEFVFFDNDTSGSEQTSVLSVGESETWKRIIVPLTDFHSSPLERELSLATVSGFKFERVTFLKILGHLRFLL